MKALVTILIVVALGLAACRTSKSAMPSAPVTVSNTESVRTEYIETVRIDTITVEVPLPAESTSQIVRDTTSHVETSLAESDAWINLDGSLGHSIKNKPQKLQAEVPVPAKDTQTTNIARSIKEVPVPYPEPVYIEREFSAWEKFRLKAFWYLAAYVILSLAWRYRGVLLGLIKR